MNAGLIFSLCAGILIGLKLFVTMKKSDKQEKKKEKDRQKAKQKSQIDETIEFFRRKAEADQHKASLEMQEFLARQMLDLEKVKRFSKERGYSSVTTNNDNVWQLTHDVDKALKYANEVVRKEKIRRFCRDLWYGTSIKNGTDAKEMTNDGFGKPRDLYNNAFTFVGGERFDLRDGNVVQHNGKLYVCQDGKLKELGICHDGKFEELEVYTNP